MRHQKRVELPRVTVHDTATNEMKGEFYGETAQTDAEALIDRLPEAEYDLSVSDDQCGDCGELFSSEARTWDDTRQLWVCPSCGEGGVR